MNQNRRNRGVIRNVGILGTVPRGELDFAAFVCSRTRKFPSRFLKGFRSLYEWAIRCDFVCILRGRSARAGFDIRRAGANDTKTFSTKKHLESAAH